MNAPALTLENVCVLAGARRLLDGVSLNVPARGLVGIVGPNGSGKTSLLRTGLGLLPCASGRVVIQGRPLADWAARDLARHVGYMGQQASSHWDLTARELLQLQAPHLPDDLLQRCELAPLLDRRFASLSGGEKARVSVARALAHGPQLLLADEPAAHLDIPHHHRLMALLKETSRDKAVVVVLHDLHVASLYCDHLALISGGRLVAYGASAQVLTPGRLADAYGEPVNAHAVHGLQFFTGNQVAKAVA
ncbi:MAG: ABC transporter ATP-binding protein [Acidovorax sp.]|nr:ABC transporter ATP-binding protein [Acidovorax sp.]